MKRYLKAIYQSFGNPALYAQVIYRWVGSGFIYLLILAVLSGVLLAIQFSIAINAFNQTELPSILTQMPELKITNGEIATEVQQPHVITNNQKDIIVTIDTTKNESDLLKEKGAILVGKDYVLTRQTDNNIRRIELKDLGGGNMTINAHSVEHLFEQFRYMAFIFVPFLIGTQWLMLIVLAGLAATLSYVVTAYMPEEFNFETRMRMGAIAITPPLIINKIVQIATPYHLGFWIILAIWVVHLYAIVIGARHYMRKHALDVA